MHPSYLMANWKLETKKRLERMESFNQETIRRIKENDASLRVLRISDIATPNPNHGDVGTYVPGDVIEFVQLGVYIGMNTYLESLCFDGDQGLDIVATKAFTVGMRGNTSISSLSLCRCDLSMGPGREILKAFGEYHDSLFGISLHRCSYTPQLMEALVKCKDIKYIRLTESRGNLQPYGGLLLNHILFNSINDLSKGLVWHQKLEELDLGHNDIIGTAGCAAIATLLTQPKSNLVTLRLENNLIDNDGANLLGEALKTNKTLKNLYLNGNPVTGRGLEDAFSKAICNTSTINDTYLSNHTLQTFVSFQNWAVPSYLELNHSSSDKKVIAARKILRHHHHIAMEPFFEWELKVLPIAIAWFDMARTPCRENSEDIGERELSALYQFAIAMPIMFVPVACVQI